MTHLEFSHFIRDNRPLYEVLKSAVLAEFRAHTREIRLKFLVEQIRADYKIQTTGIIFKLDNSATAFFSRLLIAETPALKDRIKLRRSLADDVSTADYLAMLIKPGTQ